MKGVRYVTNGIPARSYARFEDSSSRRKEWKEYVKD
jgi:hypothetical protein